MESFRPQKSPSSDRFLGLLSSSPPSASSSGGASAAFELDEQDIFSTDTNPYPYPSSTSIPIPVPHRSSLNPNPSRSPLSPFHRERNFGILAALPEDSKSPNPKFLHRKASVSSGSSSASTSPSSAARMIPVIPKPKAAAPEFGVKIGQHQYQSAPVNVPVMPARLRKGFVERDESDDEDEMLLPPHEIVDRAQGKEEPLTTFSVLEGAGRTLKGRDLRRVRNAVWHKIGFVD